MARAFVPHHISDDSALGGSLIDKGLRFNGDDTYLSRTPSSASNRRTWTWSAWIKKSKNGAVQDLFSAYDGSAYNIIRIGSDDQLNFQSNSAAIKETSAVLRDISAWYHIVVAIDTTSGTAADRVIIYINGSRQSLATDNSVSQNTDYAFNTTNAHTIGVYANGSSYNFDGYMAEINFIDGIALDPSYFGYTDFQTGLWRPKKYEGSYNTNGFHLEFKNTSTAASYTVPTASFTNDSDTALLINNNESNGSTTFTDSSSNGYSVSGTGGVSHSTSYSKFGTSSISFDGSDDSLTVGGNGTLYSELTASSNKTYEAFVYHTANDYTYLFSNSSNQQYLGVYLNATAGHFGFNGNSPNPYTAVRGDIPGGTIPLNQWNHFFVQRNADGTMTVGFNGSILQNSVAEGANNTASGTVGPLKIGSQHYYGSSHRYFFEGYMDELRISNTPRYSASYEGTVGDDTSGQGNTFTPNNFTSSDVLSDVPTNNFCTHNPLDDDYGSVSTFSEGNLQASRGSSNHGSTRGTIGMSSGKWYFEYCLPTATNGSASFWGGVCNSTADMTVSRTNGMWNYGGSNGEFIVRGTGNTGIHNYGSDIAAGTVVGVAVDMDNKKIWIAKNNSWFGSSNAVTDGNPSTGTNPTSTFTDSQIPDGHLYPQLGLYNYAAKVNFGQDSSFSGTKTAQTNKDASGLGNFFYAPPTGFLALCTNNLPSEAQYVIEPQKHFNTLTYTGDGSSSNEVTGLQFKPDLVWIKSRLSTSEHILQDSVRGANVFTSITQAQEGATGGGWVKNMNENGFITDVNGPINTNGASYVAWCWKAGGTAVTNNDGSKSVTLSANQEAGFSIIEFAGNDANATIGHGLGKKPKFFVVKSRTHSQNWFAYHVGTGATKNPRLNDNTVYTTANIWNNTEPTDTVINLGSSSGVNGNGNSYICYCWTDIPGYSKIGSYVGNANADGPFVYCGFRPAFILFKNGSTTTNWEIYDTTRPYGVSNPALRPLYANHNYVEETHATLPLLDILSNGFKIRGTWDEFNKSGNTILYMAFAEQPGPTAYATETNAR
tara:strand:+ start:548 stop:3700 length:3153 start_codon:yes stop_codon:yes gene_type:complete